MGMEITVWEAHRQLVQSGPQRQHGAFGSWELEELGVSRQQVHHLLERGIVERRGAQAYLMAGVPPSWRLDLQIGLLALASTPS